MRGEQKRDCYCDAGERGLWLELDISNGDREEDGLKLGEGPGWGESDEICEHVKNACCILDLSNTVPKMKYELGLDDHTGI